MLVKFAVKARGISHREKGNPCQDAAAALVGLNNTIGIACAADGHGGEKYFRSDRGADFAVTIAQKSLSGFYGTTAKKKAAFFNRKGGGDAVLPALKQLEGNIIYQWRNAVTQDLAENPLTETEKEFCAAKKIAFDNPSDIIFMYGTTLLAALVSDNFWFALHIGDGLCVVMEDGEKISAPIPEDERLAFGRVTSLCGNEAIQDFREAYGFTPVRGLTLATDGVTDSFEPEKYLRFNRELYDKFSRFPESAEKELQEFLPELSERGSRDDVSIAGIFRIEKDKENQHEQAI